MKRLFFFLLILAISTPLYSQPATGKRLAEMSVSEIEKIFEVENKRLKEERVVALTEEMSENFNGSMIIARGDRVLVKSNYGYLRLYKNASEKYRDKESNAITSSTFFELASISKQFTAVAILTLVEKGKLSLNDTLRKFFPELPYHNITIHNLLTHTSGLPDYIDFPDNVVEDAESYIDNEAITAIVIERGEPVQFAPNEKFSYTNTNYMLLARIVEQISGKPFEDYVREKIFIPSGMNNTFYISEIKKGLEYQVARGHKRNGSMEKPHFMDGVIGDKGVYSTAEELFLWKKAFFDNHKILSDTMRLLATTPQNKLKRNKTADEQYGYGFRIEENPHYGKLIYHGGLWHGYQNLFLYRQKDDLTIIFLTNWRNSSHYGKSSVILHILDGA